MPFEPGQSGNPNGRPKESGRVLKNLTHPEMKAAIRLLRPAVSKALSKLVAAMDDETLSPTARLKHAKDVFDMYIKAVQVDKALKKDIDSEEPEEKEEPFVFQIVPKK